MFQALPVLLWCELGTKLLHTYMYTNECEHTLHLYPLCHLHDMNRDKTTVSDASLSLICCSLAGFSLSGMKSILVIVGAGFSLSGMNPSLS